MHGRASSAAGPATHRAPGAYPRQVGPEQPPWLVMDLSAQDGPAFGVRQAARRRGLAGPVPPRGIAELGDQESAGVIQSQVEWGVDRIVELHVLLRAWETQQLIAARTEHR